MKDLAVRSKLLLVLGLCVLLLCGLGGFSIHTQSRLAAATAEIGDHAAPRLDMIAAINTATSDFRAGEALHILTTDMGGIARQDALLRNLAADVDRRTAYLDRALTDPVAVQTFQHFKQNWVEFLQAKERTLALSRINRNVEAAQLYVARERQLYDAANVAIAESLTLQRKAMQNDVAAAHALAKRSAVLIAIVIAVATAAMSVLLLMLIRSIATPLNRMTVAMAKLAAGDLGADVPAETRADELGKLSQVMLSFRDQLAGAEDARQAQVAQIVDSIGTGLDALSHGDLTARIDADLTGPFAKLKTDFNGAMDALGATLSAVSQATGGIHTGATEISQASDDLSRRTEQQAASLEETAAAMDEITATVRETASGAVRANEVVAATRGDAEDGGRVVRQAVDAMGGIERASNEISEIISVIDGIAFQTNLLALNAGVEAARAGDAGRGFAVVASEVRALAQRSAEAAKDVKTKITASAGQVEIGVALVGETGQALERIVARIGEISQLVSNITTSAEQQASGLQQVNTAVGEMDSVTQQNAAMVEQSTAAARSLAAEAEDLARHVARFRIGSSMGQGHSHSAAATPRAAPAPPAPARKVVARRPTTNGALALKVEHDADDWSQF